MYWEYCITIIYCLCCASLVMPLMSHLFLFFLSNCHFQLEQNIRMLAFFEDWTKLTDDWLAESYMIQSAACSVGTTQKLAPSGRRYRKHSAFGELRAYGCHKNNFSWWQGGKHTKFIFLKAVLPKSMARKAARQGISSSTEDTS